MKKLLLLCAVAASLSLATAEAQQAASNTSLRNSGASANGNGGTTATGTISRTNSRRFVRQQRAAQTTFTTPAGRTDAVIARTARAGDPIQMFNPAAPAQYGSGRDVTRHEVDDPYQRPQGIKLVTVEF